ncbi:uncharacterized protein LOC120287420 [Eucalyptus grandis]|uniref:uncharacterized protein LOC120287420 n=1 Tax=Eucalyptus grandis TaxID=71139 RepID=UPI00192ECC00|nr:uncharacterized protein LOC120287420 [Eucalyptus grandis]
MAAATRPALPVPDHVVSLTSSRAWGPQAGQRGARLPSRRCSEERSLRRARLKAGRRLAAAQRRNPYKSINAVGAHGRPRGGRSNGAGGPGQEDPARGHEIAQGLTGIGVKTPLRFMNQIGSPRKANTYGGKENNREAQEMGRTGSREIRRHPKKRPRSHKSLESSCRAAKNLRISTVGIPFGGRGTASGVIWGSRPGGSWPSVRSGAAGFIRERAVSGEGISKKMISPSAKIRKKRNFKDPESVLRTFQQNAARWRQWVVIYTTTLRGIRKTFEDCNAVRSAMESHCVPRCWRDVSMDSGYKEEAEKLERLIGGADEVVKLEERELGGSARWHSQDFNGVAVKILSILPSDVTIFDCKEIMLAVMRGFKLISCCIFYGWKFWNVVCAFLTKEV